MKKLLLMSVMLLVTSPTFADDKGHVSLGCTPIPQANAKPDKDPVTRINIDLEFTDEHGNQLETPIISVLHFLANGEHGDRWRQYDSSTSGFQFNPEEKGNLYGANFIYTARYRKDHRQMIGMSLWAPRKDSANREWLYQEAIGNEKQWHIKPWLTARCYEEALHDQPNDDGHNLGHFELH
jgi:hypothetical protein